MHMDKNRNVILSNDIEKKENFLNSNIYVEINLLSFSKLNEVIENQKIKFEDLIDDLKINVIIKNDEKIIFAMNKIEKNRIFKKHRKFYFVNLQKKR